MEIAEWPHFDSAMSGFQICVCKDMLFIVIVLNNDNMLFIIA